MRTDQEIQRDVADELRWDPATATEEIAVAARDGVVTLAGEVHSYSRKLAAVHVAERVRGVTAVADEIEVRLPGDVTRSDRDIAHQVTTALRWDSEVPDDRIRVRVDEGWLTLEGEVEWRYQREAAERAVRHLAGVRGVANLVTVKSRASSTDVTARIKDALRRRAELDADQIEVLAKDGKVTLRGTVHSWQERQDAQQAAWSAPGVSAVDDQLRITY